MDFIRMDFIVSSPTKLRVGWVLFQMMFVTLLSVLFLRNHRRNISQVSVPEIPPLLLSKVFSFHVMNSSISVTL